MCRLTFYQLFMDVDYFSHRKSCRTIEDNPEVYLDECQAWLEYQADGVYMQCKPLKEL